MKIEEKDYLKAKETIKLYEEQRVAIAEARRLQQEEKYRNCPEHEYVYTNSKWRSVNERICINCGHTI